MRILGVCSLAVLASTVAIAKDVATEQQVEFLNGTIRAEESEYFTPHRVVTDSAATRTIVDLDAKTVTNVKKRERVYTVKTFAELDADERARKEKTGGQTSSATPVTFEPTGKKKKIVGHPAKEYEIKGGSFHGTLWVADDVPVSADALRWGRVAWMSGEQGPSGPFKDALAKLERLPLFAEVVAPLGPSTLTAISQVKKVSTKSPSDDLLSVPAGYAEPLRAPAPEGASGASPKSGSTP